MVNFLLDDHNYLFAHSPPVWLIKTMLNNMPPPNKTRQDTTPIISKSTFEIDVTGDNGIQKHIVKAGDGPLPTPLSRVQCKYHLLSHFSSL